MAAGTLKADTLLLDDNTEIQGIKVWFSHNSGTLQNDLNISSSTDHGTGDFSFTSSLTFNDVEYAPSTTCRGDATERNDTNNANRDTTSVIAIYVTNSGGTAVDAPSGTNVSGVLA